jgi:hypothetical protein
MPVRNLLERIVRHANDKMSEKVICAFEVKPLPVFFIHPEIKKAPAICKLFL